MTDAHVVAGTLGSDTPLAGRMRLDTDAARAVVAAVGEQLDLSVEAAATGILAVTLAHMSRALRRVSVERGIDPREYTMVAFGGAGPLHAGMLLRELGMAGVLLPRYPGLFSAAGLVAADLRIDDSRTLLWPLEPSTVRRGSRLVPGERRAPDKAAARGRRAAVADVARGER